MFYSPFIYNKAVYLYTLEQSFITGALAYAELGTFITRSGAEYSYLLSCFGPMGEKYGALPAFLFNWVNMVLLKPAAVSIITLTFALYVLEPFYQVCEQPPAATKCLAALCIREFVFD